MNEPTETNETIRHDGVTLDPDHLPQGDEKREAVRALFDTIAPRYDLVNRIMTFGLDVRWRRKALKALALPAGSRVLDLACGTGDFCREAAKAGLLKDARLRDIRAVRNNAIRYLDENTAGRFGPRLADALEEAARDIHPERFGGGS